MTKEMKNEYVEGAGSMLAKADRVVLIHRLQSVTMKAELNALFKAFCMKYKVSNSDKLMVTDLLMKEFGDSNDSIRDKNVINMYLPDIMCEIHNIGIGKGETLESCVSTKNHHLFHKINEACQTLIGRPKNSDDETWQTILRNSSRNDNTLFIITGMKFTMEIVVQINLLLSKHANANVIIIMPPYNSGAIVEELLNSPHANRMIIQMSPALYDILLNDLFNQSCIYESDKYEKIKALCMNMHICLDDEYVYIQKMISDTVHDKTTAPYNYESILTDLYSLVMNSRNGSVSQESLQRIITMREVYDNRYSKITHLNLIKTRQSKFDKFIQPYLKAYNYQVKTSSPSLMSLTGNFLIDIILKGSLSYRGVNTNEILFIPNVYIEDDEAHWINALLSQYGYKVVVTFDLTNNYKMSVVGAVEEVDMDEFILNVMLLYPSLSYGNMACKISNDMMNEEIVKFKVKNRGIDSISKYKYWAFIDGANIKMLRQDDEECMKYGIGLAIKNTNLNIINKRKSIREVTFTVNRDILDKKNNNFKELS